MFATYLSKTAAKIPSNLSRDCVCHKRRTSLIKQYAHMLVLSLLCLRTTVPIWVRFVQNCCVQDVKKQNISKVKEPACKWEIQGRVLHLNGVCHAKCFPSAVTLNLMQIDMFAVCYLFFENSTEDTFQSQHVLCLSQTSHLTDETTWHTCWFCLCCVWSQQWSLKVFIFKTSLSEIRVSERSKQEFPPEWCLWCKDFSQEPWTLLGKS